MTPLSHSSNLVHSVVWKRYKKVAFLLSVHLNNNPCFDYAASFPSSKLTKIGAKFYALFLVRFGHLFSHM